jgi:Protein of unknown function (DUF2971)
MAELELPDLPLFLYRYRSLNSKKKLNQEIEALNESYIWCSDLNSLNDPMEGFFNPSQRFLESPEYQEVYESITKKSSNLGISSFSDTCESELMWAHYAGNYTGICIEYYPLRLVNELSRDHKVVRVGYGDSPPRISIKEKTVAERKMLSHKKFSWSYEREWRVLGPRGKAIISDHCIHRVYLGIRISPSRRKQLLRTLNAKNIPVWEMDVKAGEYKHTFNQISP